MVTFEKLRKASKENVKPPSKYIAPSKFINLVHPDSEFEINQYLDEIFEKKEL